MRAALLFVVATLSTAPAAAQQPQGPPPPPLVAQSQQQLRDGKLDEALASAKQAAQALPDSAVAHLQLGIVLDLTGSYRDARDHFAMAASKASGDEEKTRAARATAVSYGFERNCAGAREAESPVYEGLISRGAFGDAGEIANELARICLESGDVDAAATWYGKGHEAAEKIANAPEDVKDLWAFRWEHAQARLAARRGDNAGAAEHVAAARAILDRGRIAQQAPFFPYLTGYVAFYEGDFAKAIADLAAANQNDAFIQVLQAQAYEKTGNTARADELYRKALASTAHNPANAYARPVARARVKTP